MNIMEQKHFMEEKHSLEQMHSTEEKHSLEQMHSTEEKYSMEQKHTVEEQDFKEQKNFMEEQKATEQESSKETEETRKANTPKKLQEQPYERFLRFGAENLTEAELLAIIIRTGTRTKSALQLAEQVLGLAKYPKEGLLGLYDVTVEELQNISGIGEVKAVKLKCLTELSMRMSAARAAEGLNFKSSGQVAAYFMEKLRHRETECVVVVCTDAKGLMLCEKKLSEGSVNMSLIAPREVFLAALENRAVNIILVHNHPSGDPTPSRTDKELTYHVKESGDLLGIPLLDHIVIGDNRYVSFKESDWFLEAEQHT